MADLEKKPAYCPLNDGVCREDCALFNFNESDMEHRVEDLFPECVLFTGMSALNRIVTLLELMRVERG